MLEAIRKVSEWGVRPDTPTDKIHNYRITNVLLLLLFFGSIGETILCFATGANEAGRLNSTAPFVFAGGLWLMKTGHTVIARVVVFIVSCIGGYAMVASLGPASYFQFIFLFVSSFSVATFSGENKILKFSGVFLPLICFVVLELTHYAPIFGMTRSELATAHITVMHLVSVSIVWGLMMLHFWFFMRDRRHSQAQLVSSAKMVAIAQMASGIAHEVNNPLQLIVSYAERVKTHAATGELAQTDLVVTAEKIQNVAMRIASITKGLLALSRDATTDSFKDVSVHSVVQLGLDFCRAQAETRGIKLEVDDIPKQWCVSGRETQLSEVILNVVNNAYDAVIDRENKSIRIETKAEPGWIEFSITDSGEGVGEKVASRIFDPFFTTKPPGRGTGLGLSISQSIVVAHGGEIFYDREAPHSRFVIRLPRSEDFYDRSI